MTAKTVLLALALAAGLGFVPAAAEERGLYLGVQTSVGAVKPRYSKDVVNHCDDGVCADIANELRNRAFTSSDSKNGGAGGAGVFAGYRLPLGGGFFVSGDIEAMLNFGGASGQLPGGSDPAVESGGRNRLGEAWPDRWSFRNKAAYGVTVKLGGSPAVFPNTVIYLLGGARLTKTVFDYSGCVEEAAGQAPRSATTRPPPQAARSNTASPSGHGWRARGRKGKYGRGSASVLRRGMRVMKNGKKASLKIPP